MNKKSYAIAVCLDQDMTIDDKLHEYDDNQKHQLKLTHQEGVNALHYLFKVNLDYNYVVLCRYANQIMSIVGHYNNLDECQKHQMNHLNQYKMIKLNNLINNI